MGIGSELPPGRVACRSRAIVRQTQSNSTPRNADPRVSDQLPLSQSFGRSKPLQHHGLNGTDPVAHPTTRGTLRPPSWPSPKREPSLWPPNRRATADQTRLSNFYKPGTLILNHHTCWRSSPLFSLPLTSNSLVTGPISAVWYANPASMRRPLNGNCSFQ
jgi:hypothetical protein